MTSRTTRGRLALAVATIAVLLIVTGTYAAWRWWRPATGVTSLAILPLDGASGEPYFADGLTDDLITEMGRRASLRKLINRRSVMRYKGTSEPPSVIGRELGVDTLLTGMVRRQGDRVRITAQLVRARDDSVLWAGSFERDIVDVFELQRELVGDVIRAVNLELLPGAASTARRVDPAAYDLYLQAVVAFNSLDESTVARAMTLLEQATHRDPSFARAHALRAIVLVYGMMFGMADASGAPMREEANRALALDPTLPEAHLAKAQVLELFDWNWNAAEESYRHALALAPNSSLGRTAFANHLGQRGRYEESLSEAHRAVALDPSSDVAAATLFWANLHARNFVECAERGRRLKYETAHRLADFCDARLGRTPASCVTAPDHPLCGYASLVAGDERNARRVLQASCSGLPDSGELPVGMDPFCLQLAAALGRREPMLRWAEHLTRGHYFFATFFRGPDTYDLLKDEPRFQALLQQVGLAP